jgi:competence protein ComEC
VRPGRRRPRPRTSAFVRLSGAALFFLSVGLPGAGCGAFHAEAAGRPTGTEAPLTLHFLDVGQGDAVLIRSAEGRHVLYDGGRSASVTLAHLERLGVEEIELVVASHAHADHIGGLAEVVRRYRPRFFMDNGLPHATQAYRRLLEAVEEAGSQLLEPGARRITLDDAVLHVLPPPGRAEWGQNDNSVGLLLEHGDFLASLGGDAERRQWAWWLNHHPDLLPRVRLHKASHHGSRNGDAPAALRALRPGLVVISLSATNSYGHPHAEALSRYAEVGATVLRTDLHGSVTVEGYRDGSYRVRVERGEAALLAPAPDSSGGEGR